MNITETLNKGLEREYEIVLSDAELSQKISARLEEVG